MPHNIFDIPLQHDLIIYRQSIRSGYFFRKSFNCPESSNGIFPFIFFSTRNFSIADKTNANAKQPPIIIKASIFYVFKIDAAKVSPFAKHKKEWLVFVSIAAIEISNRHKNTLI